MNEINVQINFIKSYGILPDGLIKYNYLKINYIQLYFNNNSNYTTDYQIVNV